MVVLSVDSLPLGFRFRPTDEELINHYLRLKNKGEKWNVEPIREVALNNFEPWDFPGLSIIGSDDQEWFFFSSRPKKYLRSDRLNRATNAGYWKPTGQDRPVISRSSGMKLIGNKKTLVFYKGRAPKGVKTSWIIHEYSTNSGKCAFVLCRLFNQDVKFKYSNSVEVELTGYSPTATRSPEVMPSNQPVVQSTLESDMQVEEQPAIIERCPNDESDFNVVVPIENHNNTFVVSDVEDYEAEGGPQLEEWLSYLCGPTEGIEYSIRDEGELTGPNPAVAGSSPEGLQSDQPVVQSTSESDIMKTREQADKTDHISSNALVPKEGHHSTYMATDMQDHKAELGTTEVDPQLEEWLSYLCEPTEGIEYSIRDEGELTGPNPAVAGSSPEGLQSDQPVVQSTSESDIMKTGEQADKTDRISSNALVPKEGHHSTYMATDMQDHKAELGTTEVDPQLEEWLSYLCEPTDQKGEYSNCDEIELSGFTLTSAGSAPERMPSNLPILQSTAESYMQVGDQTASIERGIQSHQHIDTCIEAMPNETIDWEVQEMNSEIILQVFLVHCLP